jgi:hypothetical protein
MLYIIMNNIKLPNIYNISKENQWKNDKLIPNKIIKNIYKFRKIENKNLRFLFRIFYELKSKI